MFHLSDEAGGVRNGARHNDDSGTSKIKILSPWTTNPLRSLSTKKKPPTTLIQQCCEFSATLSSKTH